MKALLRFLFLMLLIVIIVAIAGIFLPKEKKFIVTKLINAPTKLVFEQVNNLNKWGSWAPWILNDSLIDLNYNKQIKGKGAFMSWHSQKYGNCDLTISHSIEYESVVADFDYGLPGKTIAFWDFDSVGKKCLVNWSLNLSELSLFERYFTILDKNKIQALLTDGIENIKKVSEDSKYCRVGNIETIKMEKQPSVIMVDSTSVVNLEVRKEEMLKYLQRFLERRGITPQGPAFYIKYRINNDTIVEFACGYPLPERTWIWKTLKYYELPNSQVMVGSHFGGKNVDQGYLAIEKRMEEEGLEKNGKPWEVRLYNNKTDKDTMMWETKIYYPVK